MLKGRKTEEGIQLFDPYKNQDYDFTNSSWKMIQLMKKNGKENAVEKIMNLFNIDEKNAREDINTILSNLKALKIKLEDIPASVSNIKYAPRTIHFDITTKCNHNCIYCYATDRLNQTKEVSTEQIIELFDEMHDLNTWAIMISGGEPFLREDIFEILKQLKKHEISTSILTNGTLITKDVSKKLSTFKNINMIQVSLDSCIAKNHDFNRGLKGAYKKTVSGIKNLKKYGITPDVEIVVTHSTENDIEQTIEFLHRLGIKKVTIGPPLTNTGRGYTNKKRLVFSKNLLKSIAKKIVTLKEKYEESVCITPTREFFAYTTKNRVSKEEIKCGVGTSILYISPDGSVYPCLFSVNPESYLGNIKEESLKEIWSGSYLLKKFRELKVPDIEKCKKCDFKHIYALILK